MERKTSSTVVCPLVAAPTPEYITRTGYKEEKDTNRIEHVEKGKMRHVFDEETVNSFYCGRTDSQAVGEGSTGSFGTDCTGGHSTGRNAGAPSAGGSIRMEDGGGNCDRKQGLKALKDLV